jgi:hypothetical protein
MQHYFGKRTLAAIGLLFTLTANAQDTSPAPEQRVTVEGQKNPSKWFKAESEHFVVYSETSKDSVRLMLQNMERLDYLLRVYTKPFFKTQPREAKVTLYFHDRQGDLSQHANSMPGDAVGLYNSCSAGVLAAGVELDPVVEIDNAHLSKAAANDTLSFLFEAYARHFLYRHTDIRAPLSFIDGFAQYFANTRFSDDQMVVGKTPVALGQYLTFISDGHRYSLEYEDVLDDNDSKGHNYAGVPGIKLEFAARSWLLTHFMLSSEENRTHMARYLDLANRDMPASKAFETAYGIKPAQLGNMLWRYRLSLAKVLQVEAPALPALRIAYTGLPNSVTDYVMMDATLKSCPSRAAGEAVLRKMSGHAGGTPNHPLARMALSRAQIDWGNPQDAVPYLSTLVGADKRNPEALYLLGLAHLRLANQQQGAARASSLEAARGHLTDAVNADPTSAAAAYALLRSELDSGEPLTTTAMTAAQLAWSNGREVNEYTRAVALMHAYAGNNAKSRQALSTLAHNRRDPVMAAWARLWQARLVAGVDSADVLAELRRSPAPGTAFKEWTIDSDDVMRLVVASAGREELSRVCGQAGACSSSGMTTPDKPMSNNLFDR